MFSIPSGSHVSTLGSPTAHLNNEKMHTNDDADNSHENGIDNLDALVNEKTTSSTLATTQRLFRRASNFANEGKKSLVLGQDYNHIISIMLQIKDGKRVQVERYYHPTATEGPAIPVLRGICANQDCPKIIYTNSKTKGVYSLQVRQRLLLQGELEQLSEPPDPGESVNFFRNYVKFCPEVTFN